MEDFKERASLLLRKLDVENKRKKVREIEAESTHPTFWQDNQTAASKMKELADLQKEITDIETLENLVKEGKEEEAIKLLEKLELLTYLSGSYDAASAILSIHAGQGGVEAMDWTEMLYRMYTRLFERKGWEYEILEETPGDEAGIKSATMTVNGSYVYGYLRRESGVHRLVRQSPFNADKLRQTSFALVEVLPLIEDDEEITIREDELDWEFYRASSHGGQNVQKVSTAVRLKHKPTGLVVTAQTERYQGQNRENALKLLRAKLWTLQDEERRREEAKLKGGYKTPGWGNQIRSYVLHPYKMVKDLRTNYEVNNPDAVLDGELDGFIEAELRTLA